MMLAGFGSGLGYEDCVGLEFSDDGLIYDFPTRNWKVALTVNNLQGLVQDFDEGLHFDW